MQLGAGMVIKLLGWTFGSGSRHAGKAGHVPRRTDAPQQCPPCSGNCQQGDICPRRVQPQLAGSQRMQPSTKG